MTWHGHSCLCAVACATDVMLNGRQWSFARLRETPVSNLDTQIHSSSIENPRHAGIDFHHAFDDAWRISRVEHLRVADIDDHSNRQGRLGGRRRGYAAVGSIRLQQTSARGKDRNNRPLRRRVRNRVQGAILIEHGCLPKFIQRENGWSCIQDRNVERFDIGAISHNPHLSVR